MVYVIMEVYYFVIRFAAMVEEEHEDRCGDRCGRNVIPDGRV